MRAARPACKAINLLMQFEDDRVFGSELREFRESPRVYGCFVEDIKALYEG
jgi:hypothetical protein